MLISAGENLAGYKIVEHRNIVFGVCNSSQYSNYRIFAVKRAIEAATKLGANAIINLNIKIYPLSDSVQEATVYGDAVIADPIDGMPRYSDKPKVNLEAYIPKQQSPMAKVEVVGDYKFIACPKCGTKYKVESNEKGEFYIKGFDDVDDIEQGLQIFCLRCGTKFTVTE